jgi:hypothetical protein
MLQNPLKVSLSLSIIYNPRKTPSAILRRDANWDYSWVRELDEKARLVFFILSAKSCVKGRSEEAELIISLLPTIARFLDVELISCHHCLNWLRHQLQGELAHLLSSYFHHFEFRSVIPKTAALLRRRRLPSESLRWPLGHGATTIWSVVVLFVELVLWVASRSSETASPPLIVAQALAAGEVMWLVGPFWPVNSVKCQ